MESLETVDKLFNAVIKDISQYIKPQDSIKIYIDHPNFTDDIQTKFQKGKDLNAKVVIDTISRLMQSGKILSLDDKLKFSVLIIREISGAGIKRIGEYLYKKQCVVRIKEDKEDSLCGLRAIVLGISYVNNDNYEKVRDSRNNIQKRKAYELAFELNMDINKPIGLEDIKTVESFLKEYQIIIFNGDNVNEIEYVGPQKDKKIILYLKDGHYDFIKSLPAFLNKKYYCFKCLKGYSNFENHPCNEVCRKCKEKNCIQIKNKKCEFCYVICQSNECYINHRLKVCGHIPKCINCGSFQLKSHVCEGKWCCFCKTELSVDHKCFILTEEQYKQRFNKKRNTCKGFIFFDYEAMQTNNGHVVNLVCAEKTCFECLNGNKCNSDCGFFHWVTNNDFCEWLFGKINEDFIAIAHNMKVMMVILF